MTTPTISGRTAVVLFSLGGPDRTEAIRPFLFNLFYDPAIIRLPNPLRFLVAYLIAARRSKTAVATYDALGGRSPLLANTNEQAAALEAVLDPARTGKTRVFVAMRYWHPMSYETALAVKDYAPDQVVLLPLYPQYSTTTTASSLLAWKTAAAAVGLVTRTLGIGCYPEDPGFIAAAAASIRKAHEEASAYGRPRILLSAHGLPERVVRSGDPYQGQCERTAAAIVRELDLPGLDAILCYQSRVGPLRWIGPSTNAEIRRAGHDRVPVVVAPIAFVSEHSETLVEIEIEYRAFAKEVGVPFFARASTVGTTARFIEGLAAMVERRVSGERQMRFAGCECPCVDRSVCCPSFDEPVR